MTTINNIQDFVQILNDNPEWVETIRSILLTRELLELPARLSAFVESSEQRFAAIEDRLDRIEGRLDRMEGRLDRVERRLDVMDGRMGNLEGNDYERRVRFRAMSRCRRQLNMDDPFLGLTQSDPPAPFLNRVVTRALSSNAISLDEADDLHNTDIIILGRNDHHAAIEVSITADQEDITRAKRRAEILARACGHVVTPVIVTANVNEFQREQAATEAVEVIHIPHV